MKSLRDKLAKELHLAQALEKLEVESQAISGLTQSAQALVVATISDLVMGPVLYLCPDPSLALSALDDLAQWRGEGAVHFLPRQVDDDDDASSRTLRSDRLRIVEQSSIMPKGDIILAPAAVLLEDFPEPESGSDERWVLEKGKKLERENLIEALVHAGLRREAMVSAPGEFSVRGDVFDVYPLGASSPVRIELWDEDIESIREFDVNNQRSRRSLDAFVVPRIVEPDLQRKVHVQLTDVLPDNTVWIFGDPNLSHDRIEEAAFETKLSSQKKRAREVLDSKRALRLFPMRHENAQHVLTHGPSVPDADWSLSARAERLIGELDRLFVFCASPGERKRLLHMLREEAPDELPRLALRVGTLEEGVIFPELKTGLINHHELQGRHRIRRRAVKRHYSTRPIEHAFELAEGDYVVHAVHGVARFRGETQLEKEDRVESFLVLEFDSETLLYVPASKIDLIERYVGAGAHPKLDRMGGKSFAKKKAQVQKAVDDLATELLRLQAARNASPGESFGDDPLESELAASFPYDETADQIQAIEEIRNDQASTRPMDRLVCGDVGFGKTEVAIRAAFKMVVHGTQVAILVPTTLLAEQHLETFRERYANFPVHVESLSRFVKPKKQKAIIKDLKAGSVDVLIGTHRILSKDIKFKNLGLVIIDEEQRFGVRHKERLKQLRETVDVLTLTATPIPRTLHMAMSGLRDISSLRTPPSGRLAPKTEVHHYDEKVIKKAILRELGRGGQVFFIHNRVQGLLDFATKIQNLVPSARIEIAHGQMDADHIEDVTDRFIRHEIDVMVCTTIVESGIDIPRVNTLIVDRADRFGLADLHQLRGRVGRSHVQAYAYFLIPKGPLATLALKRLRSIESLTHLGAGFELSLRDLELRGAGNLLGGEQHGHIAAVGYDLYCRLLRQCVDRQRGLNVEMSPPDEIDIEIGVSGSLPAHYIHDDQLRMEMLRRMAEARGEGVLLELKNEMRDRFGRLPRDAEDLINLFCVRDACRKMGIRRLFYEPDAKRALLQLYNAERFERKSPMRSSELRPTSGDKVYWLLGPKSLKPREALRTILRLLSKKKRSPQLNPSSSSS